jgi:hypothetical protein
MGIALRLAKVCHSGDKAVTFSAGRYSSPQAGRLAERRCQSRCRTLPDRSDELFMLCRGCGPSSFPTEAAGRNSDSPTRGRSFGCPQAADRYGRSFEIQSTEERSPANHSSTGNLVASRSMRTLRLGPGQQGRPASRVGSRCGG